MGAGVLEMAIGIGGTPYLSSWKKLADTTVSGGAVTSITFTGLNLTNDIAYMVFASLKEATAAGMQINLNYNADATANHYYEQYLDVNNAAIASARINDDAIGYVDASTSGRFYVVISADPDGYPRASSEENRQAAAALRYLHYEHIWNSVANVTSLSLTSSVANDIDNGSRVILFKYVP